MPGYGLAVAQAQHTIHELVDVLQGKGVQVVYGIHPVAGRMPGHMNVLLAEANVPYDQLKEMDEANSELPSTDVALVVGANDVVNPAAKTSPGSPIYGMPILDRGDAKSVVFLKRSMRPGFAGIENELLYDPEHHVAVRRRQGLPDQGRAVPEGTVSRLYTSPRDLIGGPFVGAGRRAPRRTHMKDERSRLREALGGRGSPTRTPPGSATPALRSRCWPRWSRPAACHRHGGDGRVRAVAALPP